MDGYRAIYAAPWVELPPTSHLLAHEGSAGRTLNHESALIGKMALTRERSKDK